MTMYHTESSRFSTGNCAGAHHLSSKQRTFLQYLRKIPMDKSAIHDIRLSFSFNHLWSILSASSSSSSSLIKNIDVQSNKGITLHDIDLKDHVVKTTVHNINTLSVIVSCTVNPIPIEHYYKPKY